MSTMNIVLTFLVVVTIAACNKEDNPTAPGPIAGPTNLRAYSAGATTVGIQWDLSASESDASFNNYLVRVRLPGGAMFASLSVPKGTAQTLIPSLTEGVVYTFIVRSTDTGGNESGDSVSVKWSPAKRLENEAGFPAPIKVYETTSSALFASGLIHFVASAGGPQTVSIIGPDSLLIDIYVKTEANNAVSLNSSHVFRAGRRNTRFSTITRNENTLNNPQTVPPDTTTFNNSSILIDSTAIATSKVYYFKGNDGNYGRILVERNPSNGTLIWGSSPEQYVSLRLSYQSVAYNPYSRRDNVNPWKSGR